MLNNCSENEILKVERYRHVLRKGRWMSIKCKQSYAWFILESFDSYDPSGESINALDYSCSTAIKDPTWWVMVWLCFLCLCLFVCSSILRALEDFFEGDDTDETLEWKSFYSLPMDILDRIRFLVSALYSRSNEILLMSILQFDVDFSMAINNSQLFWRL